MNKYKMISICSLTIAIMLVLSILLPIKTIANDKESINLAMHYENKEVTVDIVVNSEIYTGVVCKYLMIDNVLTSENILNQTREEGITINLDKNEDDKYTAVIKDVNKRYVVIYVSIGNCSLCDYIDCDPEQDSEEEETPAPAPDPQGEGEQPAPDPQGEGEQPTPDPQGEGEQPAPDPQGEGEQPAPDPQPEEEKPTPDPQPEEEKPAPAPQQEEKQPEIQEIYSQNDEKKAEEKSSNVSYDKDSYVPASTSKSKSEQKVDTSDFEEIEKVASTATSDDKMPQTGEDDFIKIFGIVVFSAISIVSFYKYQTTK